MAVVNPLNTIGAGVGTAADSGLLAGAQAQGQALFADQVKFGEQMAAQEALQTKAKEVLQVTMNAADISAK